MDRNRELSQLSRDELEKLIKEDCGDTPKSRLVLQVLRALPRGPRTAGDRLARESLGVTKQAEPKQAELLPENRESTPPS
jgi:hypothetical protein